MTRYGYCTIPFGERASDALAARLQSATRQLLERAPDGVLDVVPGYLTLLLAWDARRLSGGRLRRWLGLARRWSLGQALEGSAFPGSEHTIRVRYDGADLADVARATGLTEAEVVARHAARRYTVHALGFTPGFPFLAGIDDALHLPRRSTPRSSVPAHAVAIAGHQTGMYPLPSPGGWHLLGTALDVVYDPHRDRPFLLNVGDRVRFVPAEGATPAVPAVRQLLPDEPRFPSLRVEEPGLLDVVLDEGRLRAGRFGLAASGPVDVLSARRANALLANPGDAPLLEINVAGPTLSVLASVTVAVTGGGVTPTRNGEAMAFDTTVQLRAGDTLSFPPAARGTRAYLAVAGGFEAHAFLGSVSIDLRGRIGRAFEVGDVVGVRLRRVARAGFRVSPWRDLPEPSEVLHVRIRPGPQATADALHALTRGPYRLLRGDRTALLLEGPTVSGGEVASEGTPLGAIQIPSDGQPRILLNDRGSLGGYAKPAVVVPADVSRLAQARPGQAIRFHRTA